jgi:hypothetical protein
MPFCEIAMAVIDPDLEALVRNGLFYDDIDVAVMINVQGTHREV